MLLVGRVDGAQNVEIDAGAAQGPPAVHHPVERASLAATDPVSVVQLPRAIDAQTYQKAVRPEELAPLVVEQHAVGLKGVLHDLAGPAVSFDDLARRSA